MAKEATMPATEATTTGPVGWVAAHDLAPGAPGRARAAASYRDHGYVLVRDLLDPGQLQALRDETVRLCRGEVAEVGGEWTPPDPEEDDAAVLRRVLCIHFPHKGSQVFLDAVAYPRMVDLLTAAIGPNVKAMQSMLFVKPEGKPGQAWHQDEFFIPSRDRSLTGLWIALDDATVDNGCLWVLPGSHRPGIIYPDHDHDDPRFDCTVELYGFPYTDDDAVPVEVPAGSAVCFNGYLLHRSLPNHSPGSTRRALVNHYMSAESLLPWRPPREGEHMAKADYRDVILVAGTDPYSWKGTEDLARPFVRPDRSGGCDR